MELASDKPIQVSRPSVFEDLLKYYEDDTMADSTIQVTFNNEKGQDYGGLTQDVFSAFWEQAFQKFFDGEVVKVPFVAPSELHQVRGTFEAMGRIFSHGFIITSAIPVGNFPSNSFQHLQLTLIIMDIPSVSGSKIVVDEGKR